MPIPSEDLQLLIAGYVLGDLAPEEAAEFERLLQADPQVAEEVAQMQQALEISYAVPEVTPPPYLREAILSQVAAESLPQMMSGQMPRLPVSEMPKTSAPSRRRVSWRRAIDLAAAGLILALGISNYSLWRSVQTREAAPNQNLPLLTYALQPTQADDASATVIVNPDRLNATLTVENLPPLPPGRVYALWTVLEPNAPFTKDSKQAVLTEVFQVDEQGRLTKTIAVPEAYQSSEVVTNVAITIEDAAAPQNHTGSPVMITRL